MKILPLAITFIISAVFVAGCVSSGHEVDQAKVDQIQKGVTTKAQVREWLGAPEQITKNDSGDETWTYMYIHSSAKAQNFIPYVGLFVGGANTENQNTVVAFGPDGIVKSLNTSYGGTSTDTNLGAGSAPKTP